MRLYKVRAWVNEWKKVGRDKRINHPFRSEKVFVKLEGAMANFKEVVNELKTWELYSKYEVHAELFKPHIFDDGSLAYWPDDSKYIAKYPKEKEKP